MACARMHQQKSMLTSPFTLMQYQIYPQILNHCVCSSQQPTSGPCLCSAYSQLRESVMYIVSHTSLRSSVMQKDYLDTCVCSLLELLFLDIFHYFVQYNFLLYIVPDLFLLMSVFTYMSAMLHTIRSILIEILLLDVKYF